MPVFRHTPKRFYPAEGMPYLITEWDSSTCIVEVTRVTEDSVEIEYPDRLRHTVSPEYFVFGLNPWGICVHR
jgi:hypothetical protein